MNKLIILNHKMSLMYDEVYSYIDSLNKLNTNHDIIVCPSNIYLEAFMNNSDFAIGAQNMNYDSLENHTGEISSLQLKSLGIEYVMIGHYERVKEFNETVGIINSKLITALESGIAPILCFGEDIDDDYREVLPKKLDAYLKDVLRIEFIIFAYEPIYACNTGITPTKEKLKEVLEFTRKYLEDKYKTKPNIVYGGSVTSSNVEDILDVDILNGVLIGSISSNIKEVTKIIDKVK